MEHAQPTCARSAGVLMVLLFASTSRATMRCPVSAWSKWGPCTRTCGGGKHIRNRHFTVHASSAIMAMCSAGRRTTEEGICNAQSCVVDCAVAQWSAWTTCSRSCDRGRQARLRKVLTSPTSDGVPCPAVAQHRECGTRPCGSSCVVSTWASWTLCNNGLQTRSRRVLVPPIFPGKVCPTLTARRKCVPTPVPTPAPSPSTTSTPTPWPTRSPTPLRVYWRQRQLRLHRRMTRSNSESKLTFSAVHYQKQLITRFLAGAVAVVLSAGLMGYFFGEPVQPLANGTHNSAQRTGRIGERSALIPVSSAQQGDDVTHTGAAHILPRTAESNIA